MLDAECTSRPGRKAPFRSLETLFGVLQAYDRATAAHSLRVAGYARSIAVAVGLPRADCKLAYVAGLMHDAGKLFLPNRILAGDAMLDRGDRELIRRHPEHGAWLVSGTRFPGPLGAAILDHHERLDGAGYPNGLRGEEISLHARIVSVADTFDAMTSRRTIPRADAFEEMRRVSGTQLDGEMVEAMVSVVGWSRRSAVLGYAGASR